LRLALIPAEEDNYRRGRTNLELGRRTAYVEFDKAVLALSGGGLAVSISFIRDLVPNAAPSSLTILWVSWLLYASSMTFTLFSFLFSQWAFDRELTLMDAHFLSGDKEALRRPNRYAAAVRWLNYASCTALTTAIALTVVFAFVNTSPDFT
jgi:hypothetical protein